PRDVQVAFANGGFGSWLNRGMDPDIDRGFLQSVVDVPGISGAIVHELRLGPDNEGRPQLEERIASHQASLDQRGTDFFSGSYRSEPVLSAVGGGKRRKERRLPVTEYRPFESILSQVRDLGQYPEITRL